MEFNRRHSEETEKAISQLEEMIRSIKERYDKKIEESSFYDLKEIGHLQASYLAEIQPYKKQIEYLVQNDKYDHVELICKSVEIDIKTLKEMQAPIFNCLGIPKVILEKTAKPASIIERTLKTIG